jgi:AAA15 family ATPase/GTPase
MPITKITIENFKGIADRVEIDLKPITVLFGANSAGKSTLLQQPTSYPFKRKLSAI